MCGIFLIDFLRNGYKCVSVSCNNRAIILHLKVSERGPRIVSIDELGTVLDGPKHEDVAFNCGVFLPILFRFKCIHILRHCNYFHPTVLGDRLTTSRQVDLTIWDCGPYGAKRSP